MDDKKLFELMIKYRSVILKQLQNRGEIVLKDGKYFVRSLTVLKEIEDAKLSSKIVEIDNNSVCQVCMDDYELREIKRFFYIETWYPEIFKELDVRIYHSNFDMSSYYCSLDWIDLILSKCCDKLNGITLPAGFRVNGETKKKYIDLINRHIHKIVDAIEKKKYIYDIGIALHKFGCKDVTDKTGWYQEILMYGVFSYRPIYSEIEWDFGMVKRFKDRLIWPLLYEKSNLTWNEKQIAEYGIEELLSLNYEKVLFFSNEWIDSHKEDIRYWNEFVQKAKFHWTPVELEYFYNYVHSQKNIWPFGLKDLLMNRNIKWDEELFRTIIILDNKGLELCFSNKILKNLLMSMNDRIKFVNQYYKEDNFWLKLNDGGGKCDDAYSVYFTLENMKTNIHEWNKIVDKVYEGINRTSDTNYRCYSIYTKWDRFVNNENVKLTYKICEWLHNNVISLGGYYVTDEVGYVEEKKLFDEKNGLIAFLNHEILNDFEMMQIINDEKLLDIFVTNKNPNLHIVNYMIDNFFANYPMENYLAIINLIKSD